MLQIHIKITINPIKCVFHIFTDATLVFEIRLHDFNLYCWYLTIILLMFLAAAHSYLFLCLHYSVLNVCQRLRAGL